MATLTTDLSAATDDQILDQVFTRFSIPQIMEAFQIRQRRGSKLPLSRRLGVIPITDPVNFQAFTKQLDMFWTAIEAKFTRDKLSFSELQPDEKHFLKLILAIFAFQDGDVIENLVMRFLLEAPTVEGKLFYLAQALIEAIHAWSYGLQIQNITSDQAERDAMIEAIDRLEFLKAKQALNDKYKNGHMSLAERQVAYACLEGIGFSSLFAGIFSFKERSPYLPLDGIFFSNEKISQDEGLHRDVGVANTRLALGKALVDPENATVYKELSQEVKDEISRVAELVVTPVETSGILDSTTAVKLTPQRVLEIVQEFVAIEEMCVDEILPGQLKTINNKQLKTYVYYVADKLLVDMGLAKFWHVENPLPYMNTLGMTKQANFFEREVGDYSMGTLPDEGDDNTDLAEVDI